MHMVVARATFTSLRRRTLLGDCKFAVYERCIVVKSCVITHGATVNYATFLQKGEYVIPGVRFRAS